MRARRLSRAVVMVVAAVALVALAVLGQMATTPVTPTARAAIGAVPSNVTVHSNMQCGASSGTQVDWVAAKGSQELRIAMIVGKIWVST